MLHELQKRFKESILNRNDSVAQFVQGESAQNTDERLEVYRNNTFVSLKSALLSIYPITAELVSIEYFRYITDLFIKTCPPQQGALVFYGSNFPDFLHGHESSSSFPFLKDMAVLEWYLHESFGAEDDDLLGPEDMTENTLSNIENLTFQKASHVGLMKSDYAIYSLYEAVKNNYNIENLNVFNSEYLLISRDEELDSQVEKINEATYETLKMLFEGKTLMETIEHVSNTCGDANQLKSDLKLCFDYGLFRKIKE